MTNRLTIAAPPARPVPMTAAEIDRIADRMLAEGRHRQAELLAHQAAKLRRDGAVKIRRLGDEGEAA